MTVFDTLLIFSGCCLLHIEPTMTVGATQNSLSGTHSGLKHDFCFSQAAVTILGVVAAQYIKAFTVSTRFREHSSLYDLCFTDVASRLYMVFKAFHFGDFTEALLAHITGGGFREGFACAGAHQSL